MKNFKSLKRGLCLLLSLVMTVSVFFGGAVTVNAETYSGTCGENLTWSFDDSTGTLTISGEGEMEDYDVVDSDSPWFTHRNAVTNITFNGNITSIGEYAFYDCPGLTIVTIPDSVTSIGYCAFESCPGLTSVTIGNGVTNIGALAFSSCSGLTSINIPGSVTSIGGRAFERCPGLESITVDEGNPVYHSSGNCMIETESTILIAGCKNSVIPDDGSVTSIGGFAFDGCTGLTSVTIPDSITSIGDYAFFCCTGLTSVTIPDSITSIGSFAFYDCSGLTSITIPGSVTRIGDSAFSGCTGLTSISIPGSVTRISNQAFKRCPGLESIMVDEGNAVYHSSGNCLIETESKTLIAGCKNSVIPDDGSVTKIGDYAFSGYTGLISVTIPNSVTSIGYSAFSGCTGLTNITLPDSVTSIGSDVFLATGYYNDETNWENGVLYIGNHLIEARSPLSGNYAIKEGTLCIAGRAFWGCDGLTGVTIPDSVTIISEEAFRGCSRIKYIVLPVSINEINSYAFYDCSPLSDVYYSGSEEQWNNITIGANNNRLLYANIHYSSDGNCGDHLSWSFDDSTGTLTISGYGEMYDYSDSLAPWDSYAYSGISNIVFDGEITSIGNSAFVQCTGLTSITIPDSVTRIGEGAFRLCSNLENITIPDSVTSIGNEAFLFTEYYNDASNWEGGALYIGNHLININEELSRDYSVKEGTVCIASGAFLYYPGPNPGDVLRFCDWLESITIPESVVGIGYGAFYGCSYLIDVYYIGSEEQWSNITIEENNEHLLSARIHFNSNDACGENLTWSFDDSTGILTISGYGDMYDYLSDSAAPWDSYASSGKIKNIEFDGVITSIGDRAFFNCAGLTSVTIPESVTRIGRAAFYGCAELTEITLPAGVVSIEESAFYRTGYYDNEANWQDNVLYIGNHLIFARSYIKDCVIKDNTVDIAEEAFYGSDLTNITFPDSITNIYYNAFWSTKLESITVDEDNPVYHSAGNCLIETENKILTLGCKNSVIPDDGSITKIGNFAFGWCYGFNEAKIPDGVTEIGPCAFAACTSLESVIIPESVTSIGYCAFADSPAIKDVYYTGSAAQWNEIRIDEGNETLSLATIHFRQEKTPVFESPEGVALYDDGSAKMPGGRIVEKAVEIKADGGNNVKFNLTQLTPQQDEGFGAIDYGCVCKFDLSLADPDSAEISEDNPADIFIKKEFIGYSIGSIVIYHYPQSGGRESFTATKNDPRFRIYDDGEYWKITVTSLSPFGIYSLPALSIKSNPGTKTIDYGQVLRLEAQAPDGYEIRWFIGSKNTGKTGTTFDYSYSNGDGEVRAVLYKGGKQVETEDGNEISAAETVKVRSGFLQKLIAFFKYTLFRMNNIVNN